MQVEVHGAKAHHLVHDVRAVERGVPQIEETVPVAGLLLHVGVGRQQESARAAGGVADALADAGPQDLHHGLDERPRREVLPGAGLDLRRVALKEPLVDGALDVDAEPYPGLAVNEADDALQLRRVGQLVLRLAEDDAHEARALREI